MNSIPKRMGAVLSDRQLEEFADKGCLNLPKKYIQPSSFDVPAGSVSYQASCIPSLANGFDCERFIKSYCHSRQELSNNPVVLMPGVNYLIKLEGSLSLPKGIYGSANPKSSAGRLDLDCILLAEQGTEYNGIPAGYEGPLYLLVSAQSFPVILHEGDTLIQVRLYNGNRKLLSGQELQRIHKETPLVYHDDHPIFTPEGILLHLDLQGSPSNLVSIPNGNLVDLHERQSVDPTDHFREKRLERDGTLMLEPHEFVLATTKERLRILPWMSTEMLPYTEKQGPFRSHFAGYFDPGFGYEETEGKGNGSGVVLEIRNLTNRRLQFADGQGICVMRYECMAEVPARLYGQKSTKVAEPSNYHLQSGIKLAKYFSPWPQ